jgi:hypothetical protein
MWRQVPYLFRRIESIHLLIDRKDSVVRDIIL